jgi:hypothetical protein
MIIGIAPSTSDALKVVIGGDRARRCRLRGVAVEKVRLDRASGGGRRVEVAIVYKPIEFSTILGNAQAL